MALETDYAWAAGFIDADGFIGLPKARHTGNKRDYYTVRISVSQVKPKPLKELVSLFGGSVRKQSDKRGHHYNWVIYAETATKALTSMLPYFKHKKAQAKICLRVQSLKDGSRRVSSAQHKEYAKAFGQMLKLNSVRRSHAERLNELAPSSR